MKTLIESNYEELTNIARSICGEDSYEDVLHDVILKLLEKDVPMPRMWKPWVFVLIRNTYINMLNECDNNTETLYQNSVLEQHVSVDDHGLYQKVVSGEILEDLWKKFGSDARLFEDYYYDDNTLMDVSDKHNIPFETVRRKINKMSDWLKDEVGN